MNLRALVKRHPLPTYYALTIVWAWTLWSGILLFLPPGALFKNPAPAAIGLMLAGGIAPSLMGILLTAGIEGRAGLRALFARLRPGRVNPAWYLALTIPFLLNAANFVILGYLRPGAPAEDIGARLVPGIALGLFAAVSEEFGWRGFALPRLQQRYNALQSGLINGLFWALWHTAGNYVALGDMGWLVIPTILLNAWILLTAYSILQTWLSNNTGGRLWWVILFHACISSSGFAVSRTDITYLDRLQSALVMALLGAAVAALIVTAAGAQRLVREASQKTLAPAHQ